MYTLMLTPTEHEHNTHQTLTRLSAHYTHSFVFSVRDRELSQRCIGVHRVHVHISNPGSPPPPPLKKQQPVYSLQTTATLVRPLQSELSLWSGQMRSDFIPQPQATFPGSVYLFTLMCFVNQACTVYFIIAQTRQTLPCTGVLSVRLALVF